MNDPTPLLVSAHLADARGKACPAPIIDLAKALRSHPLVELWADDPAAGADVLAFCAATGHVLVQASEEGRLLRALVRQRASAV